VGSIKNIRFSTSQEEFSSEQFQEDLMKHAAFQRSHENQINQSKKRNHSKIKTIPKHADVNPHLRRDALT
jgi:hypothetical protein